MKDGLLDSRKMGECYPLPTGVTYPLELDCFRGLPLHSSPGLSLPETAILSLTVPTEHEGRGDTPALSPMRADAATSRGGLPFSLGSGISSVKVTHSTEDAAMHAGLATIQHWLFPGPCIASVNRHSLLLLEGFLTMRTDHGILARGGKAALRF